MTTVTETIPQTMINASSGERHVIQLKPREGLTAADVRAFLADREEAAMLIDPENCEIMKHKTETLDPYGLFDVPDEWSCIGSARFVRNLPDGEWVWFGDLPEAILNALTKHWRRHQ
jgi:hypothetical protein